MNERITAVAEVQGLYGPFSFAEKLLQKIWLRGDFDRAAAKLSDGRELRVVHAGKWNLLGGPDFKGARLAFGDGREVRGDVELHLHASDWIAHGHASDPAYDDVVLHVVLFPPEIGATTRSGTGEAIPTLALLPLLRHDLEEFAADEAVESLAGKTLSCVPEELARLASGELLTLLQVHAASRWQRKVRFARMRLEKLGWEAACHHAALEILGYRFNRAPMLRVAGELPLQEWAKGAVDADAVYAKEAESWSVQGVRPANHPRTRLRQYAAWCRARPDWPERWAEIAPEFAKIAAAPGGGMVTATRELRRDQTFSSRRGHIAEAVTGGTLGGTRLDNFLCDGLLPLSAASTGTDLYGGWFHWAPGDQPPALVRGLRELGVCDGRSQPVCQGLAQGFFGWLIEREARR